MTSYLQITVCYAGFLSCLQTQELEEQIQRLRDELEVERLAAEKEIDEIGLKVVSTILS